ncbi:uncharacterized protein LOC144326732 [Podarcis muralis]
MSRYQFTRVLRKAIEACGLSAQEYAAHSFRIVLHSLVRDQSLGLTYLPSPLFLPLALLRRNVWICGHSIVHWARVRAARCGLAPNLGLPNDVRVSWFARRGMRWEELMPVLREKVANFGPPDAIVIQLGENDLTSRKSADLLGSIKRDLNALAALCPRTTVFWSSLLKRIEWRGAQSCLAIERTRKLVNRAVARWVRFMFGRVIRHDRIRIGDQALYRNDGVHLSDLGNDIWLASVSKSIWDWLQQ